MEIFDVTVVMHFKAEGETYDDARGRAVQYVLDKLNGADDLDRVESESKPKSKPKKKYRPSQQNQDEYQRRYNERVTRVACPRCGAEAGKKCWNLHARKRNGVDVTTDTSHAERQVAHRAVFPAMSSGGRAREKEEQ